MITKTDSIDGNLYTAEYSYDLQGKIDTVIYNSSVKVVNHYNNLSYLDEIKLNNQSIWSAESMNRYGAVNRFTLGNQTLTSINYDSYGYIDSILTVRNGSYIQKWGYGFNAATGNLTRRTGLNSLGETMQETFDFDDLNRLTSFITEDTISISYEASGTGNIESKSDVGDYDYSGGLHDVRYIRNPASLMLSLPKHEAEYTKFNKISYLRDSISLQEQRKLYLTYGPDEQRMKTIYMVNNDTIKTKYFALENYEKEIDSEGNTRELYYISSPSGLVAILQRSENQDSIFYVHTDYLGSYDVVTTATGAIRQRYNFDPWGRRRNPLDWSYRTDSLNFFFDRGFTGHEHLDHFGLINMNGRVYDPLLAMFLSPDNYVQAPDLTQNFNRYAYCLNNPLKYSDPNGELFIQLLVTLANMYINGTMANNFEFNPSKWDWRSLSTYTSMIQGGVSGWQMGARVENKINSFLYRKRFDRYSDMIIDDFNSRFEIAKEFPTYTYSDGYTASLFDMPSQTGNISLYFDGRRIHIIDESTGEGLYNTKAYSGRALKDGSFDYSVARQKLSNVGPIPEGNYYFDPHNIQTITPKDIRLGSFGRGAWPGARRAWGEQRAWLYPMPGTETYGRGGFSIHGGYNPGSAGCLDLLGNIIPFFKHLRSSGANSQFLVLLRVRY